MGKIAPTYRRRLAAVAAAVAAFALIGLGGQPAASGAGGTGSLYLVQGLPDRSIDLAIDGDQVVSAVEGATLAGPFSVDEGSHTLTFTEDGTTVLERRMSVAAGDSTDIVLHLPVDPSADPVVTLFDNAADAVPANKASLTVAHTAAVQPADIRVDGEVLFANVANGESLNLVVPVGTYSVDIVPTGKTKPVVLGPLDLTVQGGSLNRVFAVGDPGSDDMRVVVHVLDLADSGSGVPSMVDTGSGGQAVGATQGTYRPWYAGLLE